MAVEFEVEFAQELCDLVLNELGFGCSFMGEQGVTVASSARERIGTVHEGSARIMRREIDQCTVDKAEANASNGRLREGLSAAIDFDGNRVAVFGIAGPLEQVMPLAKVMSLFVRSMMRREQADKARIAEVAAQRATAAKISTLVGQATNLVAATADASHKTDISVETLTAATKRIGQMAGLIRQIAGQTNMLSLNATIEAARAGEAGKGFAVVANEVKNLATQTAKATADITGQIDEVQTATANVRRSTSAIAVHVTEVNSIISTVAETMALEAIS
jgi:methyl-accepting chemotaxis protein